MSPVVRSTEIPPRPLPPRPFPEVPVVPPPPPPLPPHHLAIPQVPIPQTNWEYKHVTRGSRAALDDEELNLLGREGWEMVGVVTVGRSTHFYFKREAR